MNDPILLSRRALAAGLALPFLARVAEAATPRSKKFVVIICRGGMDGLSVAPPIGDPDYAGLRGGLALGEGALKLDGQFALNPALTTVHALALAGQARIAPAVASPDRARSHFEAQDVLETGAADVYATTSGWLNRTVSALSGTRKIEALSVGATASIRPPSCRCCCRISTETTRCSALPWLGVCRPRTWRAPPVPCVEPA